MLVAEHLDSSRTNLAFIIRLHIRRALINDASTRRGDRFSSMRNRGGDAGIPYLGMLRRADGSPLRHAGVKGPLRRVPASASLVPTAIISGVSRG